MHDIIQSRYHAAPHQLISLQHLRLLPLHTVGIPSDCEFNSTLEKASTVTNQSTMSTNAEFDKPFFQTIQTVSCHCHRVALALTAY